MKNLDLDLDQMVKDFKMLDKQEKIAAGYGDFEEAASYMKRKYRISRIAEENDVYREFYNLMK